uniref:Nucleolar and coiled-body phosphoprotein 1 n=1 Tax=Gongylonema pulchrum TaxID=637853 RepID=A0A183DUZ6_9BILA
LHPDPAAFKMVKQALLDIPDTEATKVSLTQKGWSCELTQSPVAVSTSKDISSNATLMAQDVSQLSTPHTAPDEAGGSSSITHVEKEVEKPKRLHDAGETSSGFGGASTPALTSETSAVSAPAPRKLPVKTRYIKALPNLACARNKKQDSAASVPEVLPTASGDSAAERVNTNAEIAPVTKSTKLQDNESAPEKEGEDSAAQKAASAADTLTETEKPQKPNIMRTRGRYRKAMPNLADESSTKLSKTSKKS